jgi:hypothetical protein
MVLVAAAIVSCGLLSGVLVQHELLFRHWYGFMLSALFALLLILNGVIASIKRFGGQKPGAVIQWSAVFLGSSMVATFLFGELSWDINQWEDGAVRSYVARAVPVLDQIKSRDGAYPNALPVALLGEPPEFFKKHARYDSDGATFRFVYFNEPIGFMQDDEYLTSTKRNWGDP